MEVFRTFPPRKRPPGSPRTNWRDYIPQLAWESLGIPQDALEEVAREKALFGVLTQPAATATSGGKCVD